MRLDVFHEADVIGVLEADETGNGVTLTYDEQWCARPDAFALSPALPLPNSVGGARVHGLAARYYFENLLPEGEGLEAAALTHRVARSNLLGLLRALGADMPGSTTIRLHGAESSMPAAVRRALPPSELSERIRMRSQQPFSVWDGTVRLSVAGYQDKLGVLLDADAWFLVDGDGLASTHLLKPEPTRSVLAGLTTNEFACLTLARAVGVPAAEAALVHVPEPVLMLTRFDRQFSGGRISRKPVIDGCQALGLPVHLKYERPYGSGQDVAHLRDGASYPALFALVRRHAAMPLETSRDLLRLAIFNVLIGNVDAHAKNLTFFVSSAGLRLAPAYDLVSRFGIAASVDSNFAFAIGDAFSGADLTPYEWAQFAEDCRISPRLVAVELASLAGRLAEAWPSVQAQVRAAGGASDVLARIGQCLLQECERQRELAREVVHVPRSAVRRDGPA